MDFMNLMNQMGASSGSSCGTSCGTGGCGIGGLGGGCGNNPLLSLLLLSGLGGNCFGCGNQNNLSGNMTCYPEQQCSQPFVTPISTSGCGCGEVKFRKRKVKEAYMEVPVSAYQVAQPMYPQAQPTNFNINPCGAGNNNNCGLDLTMIILLLLLCGNNSVCKSHHNHHRGCEDVCTTEL